MYRIRKIEFVNHPILGNLKLDFCDLEGKSVDTIIFAGENGTGKSNIINELYTIASHSVNSHLIAEFENETKVFTITYNFKEWSNGIRLLYANDGEGMNVHIASRDIKNRYTFSGIFSDVDIIFHANDISSVTSLTLDGINESRRSSTDLPTQIKQLLIDIQALDDSDLAQAARNNPDSTFNDIEVDQRLTRFTKAFNRMFKDLTYERINTVENRKAVLFKKHDVEIPIDSLSSGEKQIVFRGCFLLKDIDAINGAFVFIDEPEISLHPSWQKKIMDYYKGIFTNENEHQTSQIFAVTHSPFIIHNDNRKNDKVIVLARDSNGNIIVKDRPEYYKCNAIETIQDAFSIQGFSEDIPTLFLEGRTDELYFKKALEVYNCNVEFQFRWVGYIDESGQEVNTGKDALNKAVQFLIGRNLSVPYVCLFDHDTKRCVTTKNNVYTRVIPEYKNTKGMKIGIENALVLNSVDTSKYYKNKTISGDYGEEKLIPEFLKMELCKSLCEMDNVRLENIFTNLKTEIDSLVTIFSGESQ